MKKDRSLAFQKRQLFSLLTKLDDQIATSHEEIYVDPNHDHKHTNEFVTFVSNLSLNIKHLSYKYVTTQNTGYI